jgi:hypothetical protein
MLGNSTAPDHPLMVDWGHGLCFRARGEWICKARRLKNWVLGYPCRENLQPAFDCVIGDDQVHDVRALIILGRKTDIQMDLKRI